MTLPGDVDKKIAELSPAKRLLLERLRKKSGDAAIAPPIRPRPEDAVCPLSFAQQRLWFLYRLDPTSTLYNVPRALRMRGALDVAALQHSLNEIVRRHEVLRTTFAMTDDGPIQVIARKLTIDLPLTDLSDTPEAARENRLQRLAVQEVKQPFDLGNGPVLRARLFRLNPDEHLLLIVLHHIVSDGWTGGLFFDELGALYNAAVEPKASPLPEPPLQYADYAIWQRGWLQGDALEQLLSYWRTQLKDTSTKLVLPLDHSRPSLPSYRGATHTIQLGELSEQIKTFSQRNGTTIFITMLAALQILLHRWAQQDDIVVGTITANRNQMETERLLGCFMNFLPLRSHVSDQSTVAEILSQVKQTVLQAYAHQDAPFERLIEEVNPERKLNVNPLYNVSFQYQNFRPFEFSSKSLDASFFDLQTNVAFLDLRFIGEETADGIQLQCEYSTDLFQGETIQHLLQDYATTIAKFVQQPETTLADFSLSPVLEQKAERARNLRRKRTLAIAATFTAEPLEESLVFWMRELSIDAAVRFAPYNQVFQQLLSSDSLLATNRDGINIILLRAQDLLGAHSAKGDHSLATAEENIRQLRGALEGAVGSDAGFFIVCVCPSSASGAQDPFQSDLFSRVEARVVSELSEMNRVLLLSSTDVTQNYPVGNYEDAYRNALGRIPYTREFFTALGTSIARALYGLQTPSRQVIVLECDQTLWKGSCRDRAQLQIDASHHSLQQFMVAQAEAGMLLCLCSNNREEDVFAVFDQHPDMALRREHFLASKISREPKSESLQALLDELQISLDQFLYLDGDASNCAEIASTFPEILTLQLPHDSEKVPDFLRHIWAFYGSPRGFLANEWPLLSSSAEATLVGRIANSLSDVPRILEAIESRQKPAVRRDDTYVAPTTPVEELLATIWEKLLRVEKIGIHADFFEQGGHSLLATQLLARIRQQFAVELSLRAIFEAPTIAGLAKRIEQQVRGGERLSIPPIARAPRDQRFPLSFGQQRLWFLDQLEPGNATYNLPQRFRMLGTLHRDALAQGLNEVIRRHEALRTVFALHEGEPFQLIKSELRIDLPVVDLTHLPASAREPEAQRLSVEEAQTPFDLTNGPVVRARLFRLSESEHWLVLNTHHVASDRWSMGLFSEELAACYKAIVEGKTAQLPELPVQYADYALWQRTWLQGEVLEKQLSYWKEHLRGAPALLELPTDRPRPPVPSYRGWIHSALLPKDLVDKLSDLSHREGVTLFMTLLAAFDSLLYRYTGQNDIVVGSPIANRTSAEVEGLIGFFVNTLALRANVSADQTFTQLLAHIRGVALDAYAHQDLPFERLVEEQTGRTLSHNPIFQVLFALQNARMQALELPGLEVERMPILTGSSMFDMSWFAIEVPEGLLFRVEYNTDLFDDATIARTLTHFQTLLEAAAANPQQKISELQLLDAKERQQVLVEFNSTAVDYPLDTCLHQFFEAQVERTPDATALVFEGQQLTYRELNSRANQLAHHLREAGVRPDDLIGVCTHRSLEMVVALYAIVKAGAAYVPFDPDYPQERLAVMLEDAQPKILLTQARLLSILPRYSGTVIALDADWEQIATSPSTNPAVVTAGKNLAYAIYTSGSTGKPKGVPNVHEAIVNRLLWMQDEYQLRPGDRVLQKTPYSFDVSVWEFFWPLMTGATLVIAKPDGHKDPAYLVETIVRQQITTLHFVPSMLQVFLQAEGVELCTSLRLVFCSGEALPYEVQQRFFELCKAGLHNLYGPTEAAVDVTYWACRPDYSRTLVPIGRPVANTQIYLLDTHLQPVPVGIAGELHIGGIQLARGYLNRPELTAEKFIPDPFSTRPGARLYKTGDLARFLPDGNIEYLGRIDHQVKIRGFRIELGEIEAALDRHPGIRQSVVMAREDVPGDKRLVAYIHPEATAPTSDDLRSHLRTSLPEFMVPAAFVVIESFPLSSNGKVNRRALPAPEYTRSQESEYVAPRNPVEEQIARIWADVLRVPQVGVNDDFFAIGGHSLLATQVIARLRQAFHAELPLRAIFEAHTVAELASRVAQASAADDSAVKLASRDRDLPLSFAQQRLWFLDQLEPDNPLYNLPWALRLHGSLSVPALENALNALVARHESLRTVFAAVNGQPVQRIQASLHLALEQTDLRAHPSAAADLIAKESARPFNLVTGPLLRAHLIRISKDDHILLLNIHHIVSDRWSMGVLSQELTSFYDALVQNLPASLPAMPVQYADFAVWQREQMQSHAYDEQLAYWKEQLQGAPPMLELPTDRPRPAVETFCGEIATITLSRDLSQRLNAFSHQLGATLFMTLLGAFQALLSRYSGQDDIVIGAPIANRARPEFEGLIGFFANTLAFRTRLSGDPSVGELIARVKEASLSAYAHQDMPFEKLVEELRPERSLSRNPLVQVFFALQNVRLESLPLKGLRVETVATDTKTAKGDLFFSIVETPSGLRGRVEYNTDLFDCTTIERMLDHYRVLLEAMVADPSRKISELELLTSSEREQLLVKWNATAFEYPREHCLHELFEQQVERAPNSVACVHDGQKLTYSQLNQSSNQLAHFLKKRGVGPGQRVGLFVERSLAMMVGLLGIQKSGAAYVPLDPSYPAERLRLTLDDAQVPVLLTQQSLLASMPEHGAEVVCLDSDLAKFANESTENPASGATPEDLVYVIFTSGSTGRPKGVQVPHRAVVNLLSFMAHELRMGPKDVFPALASFAFDMCIPELYLALVSGGRVIIADRHLAANGEALADVLRSTGATIVHATPTTWNLLLEAGFSGKGLKRVIGAEALPRDLCTRLLTADASLYNFYGPTETTVWSAFHHFRSPDEPIVVGRPLANTQIYILDSDGHPVPVGVPGEIHIAGDGVTCGYLNRPELTAEKFVADPFSSRPNAKMYRTGDLGRFLADGRIEFQGRIDNQVKVRGYRIELGEIEAVLGRHPSVQECAVIAREDVPGDKRLVGYVVPAPGQTPAAADLRAWVKERVPDYMTPVAFVTMERFPLSPNGKVDRKQLPAPDYVRPELSRAYLGARSAAEEVIAGIWAEVLKLDQVGIEDDFFELGGHSLLATQVVARIRQAFKVELPLRAMFEAPTVAGLAQATDSLQRQEQGLAAPPMTPVSREQDLPLSFAQQRLWFLDQLEPNNPLYNVPLIVRMRGQLNPAVLEKALNEIVRRHESLRTRFQNVSDMPVQVIAPTATLELELTDLSSVSEVDRESEARTKAMEQVKRPFDLATGPLLRASLLKLASDDHVLILNTHHIISDRWSLGVLSQELATLYECFLENKPSPLPELAIQYADYAVWQRQHLSGSTLDQQLRYWKQQLEGAPSTLELPTTRPRQVLQNFWGGTYKHPLPADLVKDLRTLSRSHGVTFFMTLLAAFQLLLSRWSGQDDIVLGTDLANRTQVETEKLIGFFVNLLPIRMRFSGNPTFQQILEQAREVSLGAFAHQDLPFDKLVEELRPERKLTHNPLVQVLFVMQNTPQITKGFGGLTLGPLGVGSTSRFDLVLFVNDPDGAAYETWMYNPNLFDESTIARVASGYQELLKAIAKDPQRRLNSLREVLAEDEKLHLQAEKSRFEQTSLQKLRSIKRKAVVKGD